MNAQRTYLITAATVLALASAAGPAEANSRFQVQNDSSAKVLVNIFNGDDYLCISEAKDHTVDPGGEKGMGCAGGGKHRCKARVSRRVDESWEQICPGINSDCSDQAVSLPNHATLVVADDGKGGTTCKVVEADESPDSER